MLKFNVTGDKLHLESYRPLNSGSYGYYTAEFTFDSDWDGLVPHIVIRENGTITAEEAIIDNTFKITTSESGVMMINLYGLDAGATQRVNTNYICLEIKNGGGVVSHSVPKDMWDNYQAIILGYMERAEDAAVDAETSADNAATSEKNAKEAEDASAENKTATEQMKNLAEAAAENAEESEKNSAASQKSAAQALSDLLAMINSGDIVLAQNGKLPLSSIPATATQEIYVVESEDELISLTAQRGDLAELIETVDGVRKITKTWQCLGDSSNRENWVEWGTSYAVQSGNAEHSNTSTNATMINGHRIVEMSEEEFNNAVKDADTYYLVY